MSDSLTLMAVGDVILGDPEDPKALFNNILPELRKADILFGQCENNYSLRGSIIPGARGHMSYHPRNVEALEFCGFDVMSLCSNNSLHSGYAALLDTMKLLDERGIRYVGVGENQRESRKYVVQEHGDTRIAFLAYSPASDPTYIATPNRCGNNPMRIYSVFNDLERDFPGASPEVLTFPDRQHVRWMKEDIAKAREEADIVVVSFHWGVPFVPYLCADYESELGQTAIDAGADLILGHHQHVIKGIEIYKGKVIFHGMNHFAVSIQFKTQNAHVDEAAYLGKKYGKYFLAQERIDDERVSNPFAADANYTMIVEAKVVGKKVTDIFFLPCVLDFQSQIFPTRPGDGKFEACLDYTKAATLQAGFDTEFAVEGHRVRLITDASSPVVSSPGARQCSSARPLTPQCSAGSSTDKEREHVRAP